MDKQVYLFELDSVRKTNKEIEAGQRAIYNEIVKNGNTVVITYNQIVESRAFFSLLREEEDGKQKYRSYFDSLIYLFEKGKIRISQFGDIRTISQYLQQKIEDDQEFLFSAFPIKSSQRRLMALVDRSLRYSDLSEVHRYAYDELVPEEELRDLFVEAGRGSEGNSDKGLSEISIADMHQTLENLYKILSIVLRLSALHNIYIPPRKREEYAHLKLHHILDAVLSFKLTSNAAAERLHVRLGLWNAAVDILSSLPCMGSDSRSEYLRAIKAAFDGVDEESRAIVIARYQLAEAIVNLCYNYACENSICNISKHYNVSEFALDGKNDPKQMPTFREDFFQRLKQDWNGGEDAGERYLQEETNRKPVFRLDNDRQPLLSKAVEIIENEEKKEKKGAGKKRTGDKAAEDGEANAEGVLRYEYQLEKEQRLYRNKLAVSILKKFLFAVICVFIACVLSLFFQDFQGFVSGNPQADFSTLLLNALMTILFLFISELATAALAKLLSRWIPLLSLGEALGKLRKAVFDSIRVFFGKGKVYRSLDKTKVEEREAKSTDVPILFLRSPGLKKYIRLYGKEKGKLFLNPEDCSYVIEDIEDMEVQQKIVREEELSRQKFGVVYESRFNTLLVDPVSVKGKAETPENALWKEHRPYERVLPSSRKDGVVMLTVVDGRFLLLRQFRHALRREQLAFPRGFAEAGEEPLESMQRELDEEIEAKIRKAELLGRVCPDSGLTGSLVYVYYVELESYELKDGEEGIKGVELVPADEFGDWIREEKIDDGFTLSAYVLYRMREKGQRKVS